MEAKPKRVLVVEDDPDQLEIYAALLYYNGFDVDRASTMAEALTLMQRAKPDAILMDVVLPDANGLAASSTLRSIPQTAGIPVVCMSAFDFSPERKRAAGCDDLLQKPINGATLVKSIENAIRTRAAIAGRIPLSG